MDSLLILHARSSKFVKQSWAYVWLLALLSLAFGIQTAMAGEDARLKVWIADSPVAGNGDECIQEPVATQPVGSPTLTEDDVAGWKPAGGYWLLEAGRFGDKEGVMKLGNRCFALAIDGRLLSRGIVLPSYSARLIRFPVLKISGDRNGMRLQLASGLGLQSRLLLAGKLGEVLSHREDIQ